MTMKRHDKQSAEGLVMLQKDLGTVNADGTHEIAYLPMDFEVHEVRVRYETLNNADNTATMTIKDDAADLAAHSMADATKAQWNDAPLDSPSTRTQIVAAGSDLSAVVSAIGGTGPSFTGTLVQVVGRWLG